MEELQQKNYIPRVSCVNGSNPTSESLNFQLMKFGGIFGGVSTCCLWKGHELLWPEGTLWDLVSTRRLDHSVLLFTYKPAQGGACFPSPWIWAGPVTALASRKWWKWTSELKPEEACLLLLPTFLLGNQPPSSYMRKAPREKNQVPGLQLSMHCLSVPDSPVMACSVKI